MKTETIDTRRRLDVLIATHGSDGLQRVAGMHLPIADGVHYIVTCQASRSVEIPAPLMRSDIEVYEIPTLGLSNNRNAGISLARAPYCLIADNDLIYKPEGLNAVINALDTHPDVDIATFRHEGEPVRYPAVETDFTKRMPRGYSATSFEIAFRRSSIGNIRFDPNFGIGAPLACCEDPLFILDCRRAGLRCRFFSDYYCGTSRTLNRLPADKRPGHSHGGGCLYTSGLRTCRLRAHTAVRMARMAQGTHAAALGHAASHTRIFLPLCSDTQKINNKWVKKMSGGKKSDRLVSQSGRE